MKKIILTLIALLYSFGLYAESSLNTDDLDKKYYEKYKGQDLSINVYNWGEYISDGSDNSLDVNKEFELLTGIKVNYTTYASNEELYVKLKIGGVHYDIVIPSDYMVGRLIKEDLIDKIDMTKIPNYKYINSSFKNLVYDPNNEYSVPYTWGLHGIIYNSRIVTEDAKNIEWDILFDEKYKKQILMFYNPRDSFAIALASLGYSVNTTNEYEIKAAADKLKLQKPLVQAYVMDEIYDKMESGEAAIASYYVGDCLNMMKNNPDLNFVLPHNSTRFVDALAIPKSSANKDLALMYINFLLEKEVGLANIEYIQYASPNDAVVEILSEETKNNKLIYPDEEYIRTTEVFLTLPDSTTALIDNLWNEILTSDEVYKGFVIPILLIAMVFFSVVIVVLSKKKKRDGHFKR